jgi:hypothetical protein
MAGPTRIELATSGVTGRRSNRLSYGPEIPLNKLLKIAMSLIGGTGIEPVTFGL